LYIFGGGGGIVMSGIFIPYILRDILRDCATTVNHGLRGSETYVPQA